MRRFMHDLHACICCQQLDQENICHKLSPINRCGVKGAGRTEPNNSTITGSPPTMYCGNDGRFVSTCFSGSVS